MLITQVKYIAKNLFRRNRTDNILNVIGVAITFIFISLIFMFIHQTRGNAAPEVYKDRTIQLRYIPLENDRKFYPDSANIHYFNNLKEAEHIAFMNFQSPYVSNDHTVYRSQTGYVNANFFEIFKFNYLSGRAFSQKEMEEKEYVLIMSDGYAKRFFGRTDVVGRKITILDKTFMITGIFEKGSFPNFGYQDIYIPYTLNTYKPQGSTNYEIFLKAKDIASIGKLSDELNVLALEMHNQQLIKRKPLPQEYKPMKNTSQFNKIYTNTDLAITIMLLLLIPAFNIISLNNGKVSDQISDIAVKRSYGAKRRGILMELLLENLIVTTIGAIIGFLLTYPLLGVIINSFNKYMSFPVSLWMEHDTFTILAIFLLVIVFSLLSSYFPIRRVINVNIAEGLKGGEV